jgi:response regulator RpfG family c-di-GMP phosphodiesterase
MSLTPIMSKARAKRRYRGKIHPRRIVILDDQPEVGECCELMLRKCLFRDLDPLEILTFTDAAKAMSELLREDPDLFITDIHHVGIPCDVMIETLAKRNIKYPILVVSASGEDVDWRKHLSGLGRTHGVTIRIQGKPSLPDDFRRLLMPYFKLGNYK